MIGLMALIIGLMALIIGLMALTDWSNGTDIKAVFNYCKAFDLIDHSLLIRKLSMLDVPNSIVKALVIMNFKELATYHDKIRDTF